MRRLLTAVSIMLLDSAYAAEGEVWFGSYWWVPLVAIALVGGAYQYRKLKAESRALKAAREDIINRMPRRDRETKELEARNNVFTSAWFKRHFGPKFGRNGKFW